MTDLIPPDFNQCQCMIRKGHGPFRLGPKPRYKRCKSEPVFLAVELIAGEDGLHGSMTLCLPCAKEMLEDADLRSRVQLQPIL